MPLLDFSEHTGTEGVIQRFLKKYPHLGPGNDLANSVLLHPDGKRIDVFLYEYVTLPSIFEGLEVRGHE